MDQKNENTIPDSYCAGEKKINKVLAEINSNYVRPDREEMTGEKLRQRLNEALRAGQGGGKAGAQHTKVGEEGDVHDAAACRQP